MTDAAPERKIAGVVLAGGRSSRMGRDKSLLVYRGICLVDHMIELLQDIGVRDVFVSGDLEGYRCIPDSAPFSGPAAAIADSLACLQEFGRVLFVPVDMPGLSREILQCLLGQGGSAYFRDFPFPAILCSADMTPRAHSVREFLAGLGAVALPVPDGAASCFINVNTPDQWLEFIRDERQN